MEQASRHPLFSVLIAHYNDDEFLPGAVASVRAQIYQNWEIVLLDDGSTDERQQSLESYRSDPAIRIYRNDRNRGVGYTKRRLIELAEGELCGFLDADDALHPEALASMVETHRQYPDHSLIWSTHWRCNERLEPEKIPDFIGAIPPGESHLTCEARVGHFATFKKAFYLQTEGINPNLRWAEDRDLYYKLEETGPIRFVDRPLYYYRIHRGGVSKFDNVLPAHETHLEVVQAAYQRRRQNGHTTAKNLSFRGLQQRYFRLGYRKCLHDLEQRNYAAFRKHLREALTYFREPSQLKYFLVLAQRWMQSSPFSSSHKTAKS